RSGWLAADPAPPWRVAWSVRARAQIEWLESEHGLDLVAPIELRLALGPRPHAYRRIRGDVLAYKDRRVRFAITGERATRIVELKTGWRPRDLATSDAPEIEVHRAFVKLFE